MSEPRLFREQVDLGGLISFEARVGETCMLIAAERDLGGAAYSAIHRIRSSLDRFCQSHPCFATTFDPYMELDREWPREIQQMIRASRSACIGPMAAAAGCLAEYVGKALLPDSREVIVDHEGVYFFALENDRTLALPWNPPSNKRIGLQILAETTPISACICTRDQGHMLSFSSCDGVLSMSEDAALADAVATSAANRVSGPKDVDRTLEWMVSTPGILGGAIFVGEKLAVRGSCMAVVEM